MTDRRRFLSLMGIGAASAPLAAKELADKSMLDLVVRGDGAAPLAPAVDLHEYTGHRESKEKREKAAQWLRLGNKLPDSLDERVRADSAYVSALDPDIACKRSWSMCVKIAEQRQRNYDRQIARYKNSGTRDAAQNAFKAITGFEWPW